MGKTGQLSLLVFFSAIFVTGSSALLCYNCDNLEDNNQCVNVTHCPHGEMCYAMSDGLATGKVVHKTGCTVNQVPPISKTPDRFTFCTQQCSENLCNLGKCFGMENVTRGPHCLSCDLVSSVDNCNNMTQCQDNEICYFQRLTTFGNIRYRMGCVEKKHCQLVHSQPVLMGKRTTGSNNCSLCCDKDNCNAFSCSSIATGTGTHYTFSPSNSEPHCVDPEPSTCSVFGLFNTDACRKTVVAMKCPKSCGTCDHVVWSTWGHWSSCSTTCGPGTRHRSRDCTSVFKLAQHSNCTGPVTDSDTCQAKHCPIDGGWCYSSEPSGSYHCTSDYPVGICGRRKRSTCNCPAPQYGGKPCQH